MCAHVRTSPPLHARYTHTHVCAHAYIRVHPYTHAYTFCTHARTSEPLHARVTHRHTCARMYIRVRPTRTRHAHTQFCTHARTSEPLRERATNAHTLARMYVRVSPYTHASRIREYGMERMWKHNLISSFETLQDRSSIPHRCAWAFHCTSRNPLNCVVLKLYATWPLIEPTSSHMSISLHEQKST